MYNLDFSKEEVAIVRYSDNACKYVKVESTDQLGEEIDNFTNGHDYELQYMEGALSGDATNNIFQIYLVAEEQDADLNLVNAVYNHYGNITDTENVLKYDDYILIEAHDKEDAFAEYVDEHGLLSEIPEHLRYYFDYEKYQRDCEIEGLTIIDLGYIGGGYKDTYLFTNY